MASNRESNPRLKHYKNVGQNIEEGRKKREEDGLQLRKQKREEQVCTLYTICVFFLLGFEEHTIRFFFSFS